MVNSANVINYTSFALNVKGWKTLAPHPPILTSLLRNDRTFKKKTSPH